MEDRIAVFDLDGTLMCETYPRCFEYMVFVDYVLNNQDYTPSDEVRAVAQEIVDTKWQEKPSGISTRQAAAAAAAYAGLSLSELEDYVKSFMDSDAEGFIGLKRGDTAMCAYVLVDNPYPALSYMVIADDEEREWGDLSAHEKIDSYTELGIRTISMRDDFATIYGEDVQKDKNVTGN